MQRSHSPFTKLQSTGNFFDETMHVEETNARHTKIMFGDVFQTRGDYTMGTYYMGKRSFLPDEEPDVTINRDRGNPLQPSELYMTRKQMRKHKHRKLLARTRHQRRKGK